MISEMKRSGQEQNITLTRSKWIQLIKYCALIGQLVSNCALIGFDFLKKNFKSGTNKQTKRQIDLIACLTA